MVVAALDSPCHKHDRMGEGYSKKMQKLVLNRAKTNQTRDWPYLSQSVLPKEQELIPEY